MTSRKIGKWLVAKNIFPVYEFFGCGCLLMVLVLTEILHIEIIRIFFTTGFQFIFADIFDVVDKKVIGTNNPVSNTTVLFRLRRKLLVLRAKLLISFFKNFSISNLHRHLGLYPAESLTPEVSKFLTIKTVENKLSRRIIL